MHVKVEERGRELWATYVEGERRSRHRALRWGSAGWGAHAGDGRQLSSAWMKRRNGRWGVMLALGVWGLGFRVQGLGFRV